MKFYVFVLALLVIILLGGQDIRSQTAETASANITFAVS